MNELGMFISGISLVLIAATSLSKFSSRIFERGQCGSSEYSEGEVFVCVLFVHSEFICLSLVAAS